MIFNFFFITPFSKVSRSSSPPGEGEDLDFMEVRYLEYLFIDTSLNNPSFIADKVVESLPSSTKKL